MTVKEKPKTIILISPNHFTQGRAKAQISAYAWQTPYGILLPNTQTILKLLQNNQFKTEEHSFEKEHGISGIVPFIKKIFPDAKIVPIIIKDSMTQDEADAVAIELSHFVDKETLVVGSFDFSHNSDLATTLARDVKSLAVVSTLDTDSVYSDVSVDSKPGLYIVMKLMGNIGLQNYQGITFHLLKKTNSANLTQNPKQLDITSYVTGYFK
jgi:AmmeMemoRadiSam system protein B